MGWQAGKQHFLNGSAGTIAPLFWWVHRPVVASISQRARLGVIYTVQMYSIAPWRPILCGPEPLVLSVAGDTVRAGFRRPQEELRGRAANPTTILVTHPGHIYRAAARRFRARWGIFDGDLLVVNRARKPIHRRCCACRLLLQDWFATR